MEAQWAAERGNGTPFVSLQPQYSLLARDIEAEILPICQRHGLGTMVWSPLGGGVLTGRYRRGSVPADSRMGRLKAAPSALARAWADGLLNDVNLDIAEEVGKLAAELGTTSTAVALTWVRRRSGVTSVIIGPRTVEQLAGNLAGFATELPAETVARLDEISRSANLRPVTGMTNRR